MNELPGSGVNGPCKSSRGDTDLNQGNIVHPGIGRVEEDAHDNNESC